MAPETEQPVMPVFEDLANPSIRSLQPYIPGRPPPELHNLAGAEHAINLASNENAYGASAAVEKAVGRLLGQLHRYPDGPATELTRALAQYLGVSNEQLILGNGSNELLILLAQTFLRPGLAGIYSRYAFTVFPTAIAMSGATATVIPVDSDYNFAVAELPNHLSSTSRMIFIANPNNPTGCWLDRTELENLLQSLPDNILVVVDEAYREYAETPDYPNSLELQKQYTNLVIVRTFSKVYGLAGLRLGYAIADPEIIALLNRARQPFNVNSIAQQAALAALSDQQHIQHSVKNTVSERRKLYRQLTGLGLNVLPGRGNFLCFSVPEKTGASKVYHELLKRGIIIRPLQKVYNMHNFLRVTIGTEAENRELVSRLSEIPGIAQNQRDG